MVWNKRYVKAKYKNHFRVEVHLLSHGIDLKFYISVRIITVVWLCNEPAHDMHSLNHVSHIQHLKFRIIAMFVTAESTNNITHVTLMYVHKLRDFRRSVNEVFAQNVRNQLPIYAA